MSFSNGQSLNLDLKLGPRQGLDPDERACRKRPAPEMAPYYLPDDASLFVAIPNDVDRELDHLGHRTARCGQRYDEVPEGPIELGRETAVTRHSLTPIDSYLTRYRYDAERRSLGNHYLGEERTPIRQLGRVEVSQLHRRVERVGLSLLRRFGNGLLFASDAV
jgi:hypothetical protein